MKIGDKVRVEGFGQKEAAIIGHSRVSGEHKYVVLFLEGIDKGESFILSEEYIKPMEKQKLTNIEALKAGKSLNGVKWTNFIDTMKTEEQAYLLGGCLFMTESNTLGFDLCIDLDWLDTETLKKINKFECEQYEVE